LVKTYSAAAVSLSCRTKSPLFSLGVGVDALDIILGGLLPLSNVGLRPRFAIKIQKGLCTSMLSRTEIGGLLRETSDVLKMIITTSGRKLN
jgi:hypothetical protein